MNLEPQAFLRDLFTAAIDAAHPRQVLADHLPADRSGRAIVIGAGKAACGGGGEEEASVCQWDFQEAVWLTSTRAASS